MFQSQSFSRGIGWWSYHNSKRFIAAASTTFAFNNIDHEERSNPSLRVKFDALFGGKSGGTFNPSVNILNPNENR